MSQRFRLAWMGVDHPHGSAWRELLANMAEQIEIVAIMPRYDGQTHSLEERFTNLPRFEQVADLIAFGAFDGAMVCLPNNESPDAIIALAEAGKHILAEKPGAGSAADAWRIEDAVSQAGVAFQSGYLWRYDEGANRLRAMVGEGRFGKLINVEMSFVTSDANRRGEKHYLFDSETSGGGFFNWLACHYLDLLFYITGQRVVGVTARTGVFGDSPLNVEDGGCAILELEGGALATFVGGYWLPRWAGEASWTLRGTGRWVHWRNDSTGPGRVLEIHGPQPQWFAMEDLHKLPLDDTPGYGGASGVALVNDWLHAARTGAECRNTVRSMRAALELIDAIYTSSRTGRRVDCSIGADHDLRIARDA